MYSLSTLHRLLGLIPLLKRPILYYNIAKVDVALRVFISLFAKSFDICDLKEQSNTFYLSLNNII